MTPTFTVGSSRRAGGRRRRAVQLAVHAVDRAAPSARSRSRDGSRSEMLECICVPRTRTLKSAAPRETVSIASHSRTIPHGSPSTAASPASRPDSASHWLPRREPASSSAVSTSVTAPTSSPRSSSARGGEDHRRDGALHVARADAVQLAVLDGRAVRVAAPLGRGRPAASCRGARRGSACGRRAARRARAGSAAPRSRRPSRSASTPSSRSFCDDERRHGALVAGRVRARRRDELAGELDQLVAPRAQELDERRVGRRPRSCRERLDRLRDPRHALGEHVRPRRANEMRTSPSPPGPNTSPGATATCELVEQPQRELARGEPGGPRCRRACRRCPACGRRRARARAAASTARSRRSR